MADTYKAVTDRQGRSLVRGPNGVIAEALGPMSKRRAVAEELATLINRFGGGAGAFRPASDGTDRTEYQG